MMSDNWLGNESGSFSGFLSDENQNNSFTILEGGEQKDKAIAPTQNEPLEVDDPSLNYNQDKTDTQLKEAVDQFITQAETDFILNPSPDNFLQSLEPHEIKAENVIADEDPLLRSEVGTGEYDSLTGGEQTTERAESPVLSTPQPGENFNQSSNSSIEESLSYQSGFFTITDPSGLVTFDHLFDGGGYSHGEFAIFSLAGLEPNQLSWSELVKEAARRALSNSEEGYVVISDSQEGARFHGELGEPDYNRGEYLGVKSFQMRPGDTFGVMLVPNGSVAELWENPQLGGAKKPIFSMSLENPNNIEQFSQVVDMNVFQMADVLGDGHTFALEDIRIVNNNSDQDYNDFVFQVRGATAQALHLDRLLEEGLLKQDWRTTEIGQDLVNYAEFAVAAANNFLEEPLTPDLSDPVRGAVDRAGNLDNYEEEELAVNTEWVVWFAPNDYIDASQVANLLGAEVLRETGHIDNTYVWKFTEAITAAEVQQKLQDLVGGDFAYPLIPIELKKPQFIPTDPGLNDQWHLEDTDEVNGNPSQGANAINAWNWATGKGVVIGIVDDGVQQDHPDLVDRFKYAAENGLNLDLNDIEDTGGEPVFSDVETTFGMSNRIRWSDDPVESIEELFGLSNRIRWMNEEISWDELFGLSNRIRWSDAEMSWDELFGLSNRIRWSDDSEQFLEELFGLSNRIRWADDSKMSLEELFGLSNRLRWAENPELLQTDLADLGDRSLIWTEGENAETEVALEELFGLSNRIRWSENTEQFLEELFGLSNRIRWSDDSEVTVEQLFGLSNRIRWSEDPQLFLEDLFGLSNRIRWSDEANLNWEEIFQQAESIDSSGDPEAFLKALFGEGNAIEWEDGTPISWDELFGLSNRIRWSQEPELFWNHLFGLSNRIRWSEDPVLFWDTLFGMSNRVRWMEESELSWDWNELFGLSNRIRWSEDPGVFLEELFGLSNRIRWSNDATVDWTELVGNLHEILEAEPGERAELWQQWYGGENALIWSQDETPVSWQEFGAVVTDIDWSKTLDESWSWKELFGLSNRIRWSEEEDIPPYHPPGMHGTAVAGVAAAVGGNGEGVSGGAPEADLAAIQLTAEKVTDEKIAKALSHANDGIDIYNNSWKPADSFVSPGLSLAALENNALQGRNGLGNITIFAAGNDGWDGGDVNYNPFANSRYVVPVAAIDYQGKQSWYSEPGASLLVSASSSSAYRDGSSVGITTTDLVNGEGYDEGNYTDRFGGTSSSAPLVSGIVALMLEANPNLTWRDVQQILVDTAEQNDSTDSDWVQNGAGRWVNHKYGFGAVDATLAVEAAMDWQMVQPEMSITSGAIDILGWDTEGNIQHKISDRLPNNDSTGIEIPDFDTTGITDSVTIYEDIAIEKIEVVFDADGLYRGDLEIVLISPDGTQSVLAQPRFDDGTSYDKWVFTSSRHWGESSLGEWKLQVRDLMGGDIGTWNGWKLNFYGTENDTATVSVTATDADATEDGNAGQLVFTRDGGDISKALMARYSIAGNATNGSDYQELTGTVIFEPGQTKVTMGVVPFHDYELEGNETVEITLIDGIGYSLGTEISDTVTIGNSTITDRYGSFVYVNPDNGHLYLLSAPDTWLGAQNQAEALGGNLVAINTVEEQQWIVDTFGNIQPFWIGLTDSEMYGQKTGNYQWVNGETATYTNWLPGNPSNSVWSSGTEHFGEINREADGRWNDLTYNWSSQPGIIEIDPAQLDQPIVNIMVTDSLAGEEGNAGQIVIQRIGNIDQSLSVNYNLGGDATNGSDIQTLSGNIIIPAGQTLVTLPIIPLADDEIEGNETLVVNLAEGDYENGTHSSGHIILTDQNPINRIANEAIGRDVSLLEYWMERWQNGETLEQLRPEIIQAATDGQGNNEAELKIAEFYQELLGREAETIEIDYWRNQLETGATLSQVRQGIEGADLIDTPSYVYTNPVTGNRYFLTTPDTWLGAQEQAQALGGNLVTIDDADENQWLFDTLGNGPKWIGLNDSAIYGNTEGNHQWVSGDSSPFINWRNTPDNVLHTPEGEDFTETNFYGVGTWNDMPSQQNWIRQGIVEIPAPIADRSWIRQLGTVNSDQSRGVVVDSDGNVYIAGATSGSLDGNTNASGINANFSDPFLTKYDAEGNKLWTRQIGTAGYDYYTDVTIDGIGNAYTLGWGEPNITKWDSDGNQLWNRTILATWGFDWATSITADPAGNVYAAGLTEGAPDGQNMGQSDAFVVKYDTQGNQIWMQRLGTAAEDQARSVATDAAGNVYIAGITQGSLDGNTNAGSTDVFLTKYDASGVKLWTRQFGSAASEGMVSLSGVGNELRNVQLSIDSEGNIYLSGTTEGDLNGNTNGGGQDAFLVKYDPNGTQLWTEQVGTAGDDRGWGVTVDRNGMVYWTGTTQGSLNGQPHFGSNDTFVTTLDSDGNFINSRIIATANDDIVQDITSDRSGNIYITGNSTGSVANTNAGNYDAWVSKNTFVNIGPIISEEPTNLIQNGDFEAVDISGFLQTYNDATLPDGFGWSLSNANIDLINLSWSGVSGTSNPDGIDQSLDIDSNATLSQTFTTEVGQTYELSFWYAHNPDLDNESSTGYIDVTGNNSLLSTTLTHDILATHNNMQFVKYTTTFTADSNSTTLSFQGDAANGAIGFVIDDVRVVPVTELNYEDFSSLEGLNLIGSAAQLGDTLRLTPKNRTSGSQAGAVWHATPQSVEDGFETTFQFQINDLGGSGGDGFAFVIQNSSADAIGGGGGTLGYSGIYNSLAVEFDTFDNDETGTHDPSDNHLSVHTGGTGRNSVGIAPLGVTSEIPNMSDGEVHTVKVKYIPGTLQIFMDDLSTPVLTVPVDLGTTLDLDDGNAWVGFTAAAAGAWENHDILNWTFSNPPLEETPSEEHSYNWTWTQLGEDLHTGDNSVRLPSLPNSENARDEFVVNLINVETVDFENFAHDDTPNTLNFGNTTATLSGDLKVQTLPTGTNGGMFPTSGDNYLLSSNDESFTINFSSPQSAFGFTVTDAEGDPFVLTLHREDGTTSELTIPVTASWPANSGSALFFGVTDTDTPFTGVTVRKPGDTERIGVDDLIIGQVNPNLPATPTPPNQTLNLTYTEDTPLNLRNIVVTDPDGETTVTLTLSNPAAGVLTNGVGTGQYNATTGVWTANGAVAEVNAALADLQFVPTANFNQDVSIALSIADDIAAPLTGAIALQGIAVNDAPTLTTSNLTLTGATENAGFTVTHADLVAATGATDIDGDPLTFRIQTVGSDIPTKNGEPVEAGVTTLSAGEAIVWTPTTVGNAQPAFTVTLTDGKVTVATPVTVSIDVNPVTVSIEATDPDATEGGDTGEFTFTRTGDTTTAMTVNFTIEPSIHWGRPQAKNGTDYATIPTSITIPEGETSITLTITSLEDTETEWPETVRLQLAEGDGYEINSSEHLDTVVIWDNETPQVQLMAEWYSGQPTNFHRESYASESRNDEHFLLRRIGSLAEDLTVYYSLPGTATNGEDYEELPGSITIPAGKHDVSFTFIPIDDSEVEGDETVEVTLTPDPTYTFMNHQGRIWDRIPLTLVDNDDKPTVEITVSDNQASEYGDPGQFTISRTGDTSNPLTVDYWISTGWWHKAKNGIDYEVIPESITIPAGESSITIDINPIDDSELEEDEIVDIYLKSNPNYAMRGTYYAQLKILDNETQSLQSQQQFGTSADDVANSIAVDSAGNTYTVGHTSGNLGGTNAGGNTISIIINNSSSDVWHSEAGSPGDDESSVMQASQSSSSSSQTQGGGKDAFIVKRDSSGSELWEIQLGTAGDDEAKQIAVDSADNLYVLGWSGDPSNSWIAKYDSNGTQQWQKPLGSAGYDITNGALTLGNDGSLYVTGRTTGDIDGTNQGATDTWVAKYDSDGIQTWVKQLGSIDEDEALGIAVDNNNNVYITGETKGSLAGTREGDGDAWVAQLDSSGNLQWQTQLGTTAVDIARSVAVDNNGHVYLGGQTFGWLGETYPGDPNDWVGDRDAWWKGIHGDTSGLGGTYYGNGDAWVTQLDSTTGSVNWKRLLGTTNADSGSIVVADSLGNVYLTGTTEGKLGNTQFGANDIFIAKYNIDGALQWKQQFGNDGDDIVNDMILDITGIYLVGDTTGDLDGSNLGEKDAWILKLS
ncbi:SBBP repeat-containing protein [Laspinema olomoucense]|uniref:SBBP repeat-containing protein n=1 Tax=Laspinema olomoucense TaxID=3231600 RepID=UPI0021BA9419|nr:SBBP repeat-containing protein [Laspinema sp. D3c]MCT7997214.1 SBBP repeat-containing protein [Laspinema sp. D3c]